MKTLKTILLFICAAFSTYMFLGSLISAIVIMNTAKFVSGKTIVIGIFILFVLLFGILSILFYRKLYLLSHQKQNKPSENNTIPEPIVPEITSNHIEPVPSTSNSDVEIDSAISKSDEAPSIQYVETGNVVYRTDGKSITDEEIPYLIRDGYAKTTANWKVPSLIRQITESYQIICKTNDPETLCSRYNFIVEKIDELAIFEQQGLLDKNLFTQYKALITDDNHYKLIGDSQKVCC